ncbi:AMP-binding protein [Saccharothrix deserti]|uniref:AMP-binding protein n=1 Tax=Saccharothrix deserti TaxID=2593674 RepID=UPI00131C390B|nr:class I adenylate-forming enzyme family protein [Saccharothrix deserti]
MSQSTHPSPLRIRPTAAMPLVARLRLLGDRDLGVGNFLDRAHRVSPTRDEPFLFAQRPDGTVEPLSLDRLVEIRTAYAAHYHAAGVRKGDPVGVYLGEGVESFLHFLALSSLGAIATLVNGRMDPDIAAAYLTRVGAVGVVADARRLGALQDSGALPESVRFRSVAERMPDRDADPRDLPALYPYPPGDEDPVMLCHTSGTTGPPKSAIFAHRQFFLGKRHRLWTFPSARGNRMLSALPQSHSAGISYLMTATLLGLPTLVMADSSGKAVHAAMRWFRPMIVVAFPQTYAELAAMDLDRAGTAAVHSWINTGDSAHEAHIKALIRHGHRPGRGGGRAGSRFIDGLGSSEMGMALFRKVSEPERDDYDRCVGTPVGVVRRATVLDDDGRELGPGQVGRLGVRTPTRTPGYWNNSELTTKSSTSGYWLTGDVVYRDRKGRFFHLDRVPDVIHGADGPVHSLPLEEAILASCPQVTDCAVVAVRAPAPETGHVPFATVKLRPDEPAPDDLLGVLNAALDRKGLARLRGAVVAAEPADFPTGATGKVLKRQLRERFADVLDRQDRDRAAV